MPARQAVYLQEGAHREMVSAELVYGVSLAEIEIVQQQWFAFLQDALREALTLPEHKHWDWVHKARYALARRQYELLGVLTANAYQGLLLASTYRTCRSTTQRGQGMVYLDYLSTAPWNLRALTPTPRFLGVGQVLIGAAIEMSITQGFEGRIGLHSLPQAESFYSRCGMLDLGIDMAGEALRYYEMTAEQARHYMER